MNGETIWPEGIQCAVAVTVNLCGESIDRAQKADGPLWGRLSYGRYGMQIGIERILNTLDRFGVRATFFVPAWDAEREPHVIERVQRAGHEIAGHGYLHEDFSTLDPEGQEEVLAWSERALERVTGERPVGWRAPDGLMTADTRPLLLERGYRYDSSYCDDDIPYRVLGEDGRVLVEIPTFETASDTYYYRRRRGPGVVEQGWKCDFDALYDEGGLFTLTVSPRGDFGSGRAVRIRAVERLLAHIRRQPRVWIVTCGEIADWALEGDGAVAGFDL